MQEPHIKVVAYVVGAVHPNGQGAPGVDVEIELDLVRLAADPEACIVIELKPYIEELWRWAKDCTAPNGG